MPNTCICYGDIIPEGRQVCPRCEGFGSSPDAFMADGTPIYLGVNANPKPGSLQLLIYDLLTKIGKK